ncbi:hypothetical protein thalar_00039 [Litoreibacter arenae DSM 19593]|uniref:Uncharacterized protein n=1 Tax=Litoreibacter arenae DSM 19593 TaxID=1123360 RepID=S9S5L1_9RHOB|nr:hypothetical protein thalar_00039 [Litoreibacter arenae DSM 19593]
MRFHTNRLPLGLLGLCLARQTPIPAHLSTHNPPFPTSEAVPVACGPPRS